MRKNIHNIWMVTREYGDFAGAGGVKDVARQLARALARWNGRTVQVVMPLYGFMDHDKLGLTLLADPLSPVKSLEYEVDMHYPLQERREQIRVWSLKYERVILYFLESERFAEKSTVYTYTTVDEQLESWQKQGEGHVDYFAMNLLLQKGALALMQLLGQHPDVIHCHDGHTAVLPAMIHENSGLRHYFRGTGVVVTLHNGGEGYHQEVADLPFAYTITGLPWSVIKAGRLNKAFDPFMVASSYCLLNTVSENYARELQETDDDVLTGWLGHALKKKGIHLAGVTNGIDPEDFDPEKPEAYGLAAGFSPLAAGELDGKLRCKEAILKLCAPKEKFSNVVQSGYLQYKPHLPLFTFVGRLNSQKGVPVLIDSLKKLLLQDENFQVLILGSGGKEEELELATLALEKKNLGRICLLCGYDPLLAGKIYAAGDFFLIPSTYEPCGLTDYMAQLFANLPVVHNVGGLVKVQDSKTGFTYQEQTREALAAVMQRAIRLFENEPATIRLMQRQAVEYIEKQAIWGKVMKHYLRLYQDAADSAEKKVVTFI